MENVKKYEMYDEYLDNITADPTNPNTMTKTQIDALMKSMEKFGLIVPIIVNQDNIIIDGHQRKIAAEKLDIRKHPIIKINTTEFDQKLLKQILNKLKGTHDADLDLEEFRVLMESDSTLGCLKDFVDYDNNSITDILNNLGNSVNDVDFQTGRGNDEQLYISRTLQFTPLEIVGFDEYVKGSERAGKTIYEMIINESKE